MNFQTIYEDVRARYIPFDREVTSDRKPLNFIDSIKNKKDSGVNPIISEIKPASPSGKLRDIQEPATVARVMEEAGACGISVLTEKKYFDGSLENLAMAKKAVSIPILRKDFIFHPTQVKEAYYYGADSLLLISSFFHGNDLRKMIDESRQYGMEPLVEIHSKEDGETAMDAGAKIFVINNRDKDTMEIDLDRSRTLSQGLEGTIIGASGMSTLEDVESVLRYCDAALIGTAIMKAPDIGEGVRGFVHG